MPRYRPQEVKIPEMASNMVSLSFDSLACLLHLPNGVGTGSPKKLAPRGEGDRLQPLPENRAVRVIGKGTEAKFG